MDRSGGVVADVPSTSGAGAGSLGAGSGSLGGEREIRAKVENCKVKINTWETDFAKAHGRKPTGDEVRADKQVYAMYREYRVLKADLEKENAAQTRGGAKPSAPESRVPTTSAPPLRDVGSNAPRPSARRPAADSSDDEDDDECVEATPVKKAAIRSRPTQSQPGPPEARAGAPTLPAAAAMPPSTSAIAKPEAKLPPRVASKPVGGTASSGPSLARAGSGMHKSGPAMGGFARMADRRKAAAESSSFEPLLCDGRGVLGSEVVTKAGGGGTKRAPEMTLSSFLEDDGKEKKKAPVVMPEPPKPPKEKRKAPPMPVYDVKPKSKAPERSIGEPDEDEMLAMMEAEERGTHPSMPADDDGEDLTAAEERAAARAAKKREEAVAKRNVRMAAEKRKNEENSDDGDGDYSMSDSEEFAIAVAKPKRRRAAAPAKPKPAKPRPPPQSPLRPPTHPRLSRRNRCPPERERRLTAPRGTRRTRLSSRRRRRSAPRVASSPSSLPTGAAPVTRPPRLRFPRGSPPRRARTPTETSSR